MEITQWIGIVAGVLTASSMLPQLVKVIKNKEAEDISLLMLVVLMSGIALWIVYGWYRDDWPIIITNSFSLLVNMALTFFRVKYRNR